MKMRRSRGQVNLEILRLLSTENRKATLLAGVTGLNYRQAGLILTNLRKKDVIAHVVTGEWKITRRGVEVMHKLADLEGLI
jgi:predicted transcriptional regulator